MEGIIKNTSSPVVEHHPKFFCLDVGGSGTRGVLYSKTGGVLARADGPAGALGLGAEKSCAAIRVVWNKICAEIGLPDNISKNVDIWGGVAGNNLPGRSRALAALLSDFSATSFVSDGYGALLAATKALPGGLISVGTGVTALRLHQDGTTQALSGWGHPGGDLGGGAWIGQQAVLAYCRHRDTIMAEPSLGPEICFAIEKIVGRYVRDIQHWLANATPGQFATLAPLVIEQAGSGNIFCMNLLRSAAKEIVLLAEALFPETKQLKQFQEIYLAGGLADTLLPLCGDLAPSFQWQKTTADPVEGLYLLATGRATGEQISNRPNS